MKASIWHILASIGVGALGAVVPTVQGMISSHPTITAILAAAWGILGAVLQSPNKGA